MKTAIKSPPRRRWKRQLEPYFYLTPVMVLMIALLFVPIILVISYSFFDNVLIVDDSVWVGLRIIRQCLQIRSLSNR